MTGRSPGEPRHDLLFDPRRLTPADWALFEEVTTACAEIAAAPLEEVQALGHLQAERGARSTVDLDGRLPGDETTGVQNVLGAWKGLRRWQACGGRADVPWLEGMNATLLEGLDAPGPRWRDHMLAMGTWRAPHPSAVRASLESMLERLDLLVGDKVPTRLRPALGLCRAVLAHVHVALVHPFTSGNGRTARMLELAFLLDAGVPEDCAHVLAVHYERDRAAYLDALSRVSQERSADAFVRYAVRGLREGVVAQRDALREVRRHAAYPEHARSVLGSGRVGARRAALASALLARPGGIRRADLGALGITGPTGRAATDGELEKDLDALKGAGLAMYDAGRWKARTDGVPLP